MRLLSRDFVSCPSVHGPPILSSRLTTPRHHHREASSWGTTFQKPPTRLQSTLYLSPRPVLALHNPTQATDSTTKMAPTAYPRGTLKKIVKAHSNKAISKNVDILVRLALSYVLYPRLSGVVCCGLEWIGIIGMEANEREIDLPELQSLSPGPDARGGNCGQDGGREEG